MKNLKKKKKKQKKQKKNNKKTKKTNVPDRIENEIHQLLFKYKNENNIPEHRNQ